MLGFHSVERDELRRIPEFRDGVSDEAKSEFLNNNRRRELAALAQIWEPISSSPNPLDMITLVTKQDLRWKERYDVKRFYEEGAYASEIEKILSVKGRGNFTHHYASVSFGQINFKTADGHIIFETAAGYDNGLLTANFSRFLELIKQLSN